MKHSFLMACIIITALFASGSVADTATDILGGDIGTYRVHANVNGAKVYFDEDYKGEIADGILDVPVYLTGTPYHSFSLEKEGYYPYSGPIQSVPAKGSIVHIYATMQALRVVEYGRLHLLVTPVLASVSIDGTPAGEVPETGVLIIRDIVPGTHYIHVAKQGYTPETITATVGKNEIMKVPVTLSPASSGPVTITSNPAGARIFLDGQDAGVTPLTIPDLALGMHTLVLKMDGYQDYTEQITVTSEGTTVSASLVPTPAQGGIRLSLSPLVFLGALFGAAILLWIRREGP
jgi:hypothetical protein